ncbi:MAG: TIGR03936 family radical SAM-associated protein [bacterium]|nr:TIGR03936 family radical SAM-associated protein [bacterium]
MRMFAVYQKHEALSFISHLDIQRTLQRAFRRARIPLAYSDGFNPHPQLSFAAAVPTGAASTCEWFEVRLSEPVAPEAFLARTNAAMPDGLQLLRAFEAPEQAGKLTVMVRAAEYRARLTAETALSAEAVQEALDALLAGEIIVNKRTKGGVKPVDIRPQIMQAAVEGIEGNEMILRVLGKLQADGGLRVELLTDALFDRLGAQGGVARICRTAMYFDSDGSLPRLSP